MANRWQCKICKHRWSSDSPAAYWCPSCGVPRVHPRPSFVVLEGIDACGKSEQAKRLAEDLGAALFSFPDCETPIGRLIGAHLRGEWAAHRIGVDVWHDDPDIGYPGEALIFQALHSANRLERAGDIAATLANDQSVVADRYIGSGLVYGAADGLDLDYLERLHAYLPQPDAWILLDVDLETSVARRPERRDRYERNVEYMQKVCLQYRQLWIRNEWPIVDGRGPAEDVAAQIREVLL